jgi:uncharacterized membrane protein YeaQ/YmgE (transglycosylase-associated protein family)
VLPLDSVANHEHRRGAYSGKGAEAKYSHSRRVIQPISHIFSTQLKPDFTWDSRRRLETGGVLIAIPERSGMFDPESKKSNKGKNMTLLWTLLIGLAVGIVAKMLMPGKDPGGFIITILLGIAGSFLANAVGKGLGWYADGQPAGFIASVGGAALLLLLYRVLVGRRVRV